VLEHHSNLTPEKENWRTKILSENWDAPVIFTTNVQFLEALYGGGTRGVRRMHQLAKTVIIFDEIQALPINCVHLFNNSINFLVETCGSSVLLCTATKPLLNKVDPIKGSAGYSDKDEIVTDVNTLFEDLKRVEVANSRKAGRWSDNEIAEKAVFETRITGSCLIVTNTKKTAKAVYQQCAGFFPKQVFHLSTDMCPAHRFVVLETIRNRLDLINRKISNKESISENDFVICVSTQLIEAGVDVDFGTVIRCIAGLDSIAQAAGRCNRNKTREIGQVFIVNSKDENLDKLPEIRIGQKATERVLGDFLTAPETLGKYIISPAALERFFKYYFFDRKNEMDYPIKVNSTNGVGRDDTLLNLLSVNDKAICEYRHINDKLPEDLTLNQSFAAAGKVFQAINAPTRGIVVPYGKEGKEIICDLCSAFDVEKQYALLKKAQRYSVNLYPWRFDKLADKSTGAIMEAQEGSGIYYLDETYYDDNFGISDEPVKLPPTHIA
jgi:CRISPR-associated endonuclease/helicase Cas3